MSRLHPEALLAQVALMHIAAFYLGHRLAGATVAQNCLARARAISLTTGMQVRHEGMVLQQNDCILVCKATSIAALGAFFFRCMFLRLEVTPGACADPLGGVRSRVCWRCCWRPATLERIHLCACRQACRRSS